jgi:hypothetical protein
MVPPEVRQDDSRPGKAGYAIDEKKWGLVPRMIEQLITL